MNIALIARLGRRGRRQPESAPALTVMIAVQQRVRSGHRAGLPRADMAAFDPFAVMKAQTSDWFD